MVQALRISGHHIRLEAEQKVVLAAARSGHFDASLVDFMNPHGKERTLFQNLKIEKIRTPTMFLTAPGRPEQQTVGSNLGADACLNSPCEVQELLTSLCAVAHSHEGGDVCWVPRLNLQTSLGPWMPGPGRCGVAARGSGVPNGNTPCWSSWFWREAAGPPPRTAGPCLGRQVAGTERVVDTYVRYLRQKPSQPTLLRQRGLRYRVA
jgi:CheY-like chemotaxis protein